MLSQAARQLVEAGANVNARTSDAFKTPLRLAMDRGRDVVAHFLQRNGALEFSNDRIPMDPAVGATRPRS